MTSTPKLRFDLVPFPAVALLAHRFTLGAAKYGDRNWERGIKFSETFRSLVGHLEAWYRGEDVDPDDGGRHIDAALWNVTALAFYTLHERRYRKFDNRPKLTKSQNAAFRNYLKKGLVPKTPANPARKGQTKNAEVNKAYRRAVTELLQHKPHKQGT